MIYEWSSDTNSRCSTDAQHVQLGLIQTHVPQSQPCEHTGENDEDRYETPKDDPVPLGELLSFSVAVANIADLAGRGGFGGEDGG